MLEFNLILGCKMSLSMLLFILKTSGKDWSQSWFKQSVFHCGDHWNVIFFGIYKIYICESGFSRSELEQFTGSVSFKLFIELLGYFSFQFRVLPLRKYLQTRQCKVYVVCYGILHCWRSHQQSCFQIVSFCWEGHPGFLFGHDTCNALCIGTIHLPGTSLKLTGLWVEAGAFLCCSPCNTGALFCTQKRTVKCQEALLLLGGRTIMYWRHRAENQQVDRSSVNRCVALGKSLSFSGSLVSPSIKWKWYWPASKGSSEG